MVVGAQAGVATAEHGSCGYHLHPPTYTASDS